MRANKMFGKKKPQVVMLAPTRELALQVSPLVSSPDFPRAATAEALQERV
jgi:hypothetical protein